MWQEDAWHNARDVHDVTRQTILRKYGEVRDDRALYMTADEELFMRCTKTMNRQRWQQRVSCGKIKSFKCSQCCVSPNGKTKSKKQSKHRYVRV